MAPIRIGIIGLSSNGGWASSAWAPYLQQTDHYKVIAVCNSSIQSSKTAIDSFGLEHARPYDSPADLAQDDQVELVICCVSVFHHYEVLQPALESGKDVYVEWPLAENLEIAGKLVKLAKNGGGRTQVGLQGRFSDAVSTIARFLDKGDEVGKVLSTSFSGSSANPGTGKDMQTRYRYFLDGNKDDPEIMPLIYLGHVMDFITHVLGDVETVSAELSTSWPIVDVYNEENHVVERNIPKHAADQAFITGRLVSSIPYSLIFRGGDPMDQKDGLRWTIIAEKGELQLSGDTVMLNIGSDDLKLRWKEYATGKIKDIPITARKEDLSHPARNVGMALDSFAERDGRGATFDDAMEMHHFVEAVYQSARRGGVAVPKHE